MASRPSTNAPCADTGGARGRYRGSTRRVTMRVTPRAVPEDAIGATWTDGLGGEDSTRETRRVDTCKSGQEVADHIRRKVIYEGLELEELGIDLADITDDVRLFDEDGLNLDSIDALEILAGVQREFGLSLPDADQAFIDEHCATVGRLASMVADMSGDAGVREPAAERAVESAVPDVHAGEQRSAPPADS